MRGTIYTYQVFDITENRVIADFVNNREVQELIGIPKDKIPAYVIEQWTYKKRYKIYRNEAVEPEKTRPYRPVDIIAMQRFDEAMAALRKNYSKELLSSINIVLDKAERKRK